MDVARFQGWQSMLNYIRPVAAESLGKQYNRTYPQQQRKFGRNQIHSPIHDGLDQYNDFDIISPAFLRSLLSTSPPVPWGLCYAS